MRNCKKSYSASNCIDQSPIKIRPLKISHIMLLVGASLENWSFSKCLSVLLNIIKIFQNHLFYIKKIYP